MTCVGYGVGKFICAVWIIVFVKLYFLHDTLIGWKKCGTSNDLYCLSCIFVLRKVEKSVFLKIKMLIHFSKHLQIL